MKKLNQWYDNLQEPYRFLFFLVAIAIPFSFALGDILPTWVRGIILGYAFLWMFYRIFSPVIDEISERRNKRKL